MDRFQQLPVGAIVPLLLLATLIGAGIAALITRERR
jgi:hypothetical protein